MHLAPNCRAVAQEGTIFRSQSAMDFRCPPSPLKFFPLLYAGAKERGSIVGQSFVIRHRRVGILNVIGEMLDSRAVILLIGERPGLATAESLSAYMAYRPRRTHSDADRNLISNIHARGTKPEGAATRILNLIAQMLHARASGYNLREEPATQIGK
jgi:ethanolamine ammonia-lyase small subunit